MAATVHGLGHITMRANMMRTVEAKHIGKIVHVVIPDDAKVEQLRAACGLAINKVPTNLTLLCAGRKITNDSAAVIDVLPDGGRLMIITRTPGPLPRLTLHDARRDTVAHAVEVPSGGTVLELILIARAALKFPISVRNVGLYSAHLAVFLDEDRLVSEYNLPFHSEAYLVARPGTHTELAVPRVSSRLRGSAPLANTRLFRSSSERPHVMKMLSPSVTEACKTGADNSTPHFSVLDSPVSSTTSNPSVSLAHTTTTVQTLELGSVLSVQTSLTDTSSTLPPCESTNELTSDIERLSAGIVDRRSCASSEGGSDALEAQRGSVIGQAEFRAGMITTRTGGNRCGRSSSNGFDRQGSSASQPHAHHLLSTDHSTGITARRSLPSLRDLRRRFARTDDVSSLRSEGRSSPLRPPACAASAHTLVLPRMKGF